LGWIVGTAGSSVPHRIEEYETTNGPADYALFVNGVLLAIIEAKKVTVNPQNVLEQAKRYSSGASQGPGNWDGFRVPFLYATNGEIISPVSEL
jgi:type I restriction enzyme R subunit